MKHSTLIQRAIEYVSDKTRRDFQFASEYAEPGYSQPESGIVFGNWNPACGFDVPRDHQKRDPVSRLAKILEKAGYELEWEDEWTTCQECGKAVRTQPDCYHWTSHYRILNDCELICLDCMDWESYLESIEDNPSNACPPDISPEEFGYIKFNGNFETGFHPGQTDNPKATLAKMHAEGMRRVVFRLKEQSQFYTVWEAYYKTRQPEASQG